MKTDASCPCQGSSLVGFIQPIILSLLGDGPCHGFVLMQNIGRFGQATLITTMENGLFLIPLALLLPRLFGEPGLVWCKPAASACALLACLPLGLRAWKAYLCKA